MPEDPPRPDVPLLLAIQELGHGPQINHATNDAYGRNERTLTFRPAPSIPFSGQEGDVLVMRNGQPTWVSPREAFRLDTSAAPDGHPTNRELFENLITIEARKESYSIPRPPDPPESPPKHRSAWDVILNGDD